MAAHDHSRSEPGLFDWSLPDEEANTVGGPCDPRSAQTIPTEGQHLHPSTASASRSWSASATRSPSSACAPCRAAEAAASRHARESPPAGVEERREWRSSSALSGAGVSRPPSRIAMRPPRSSADGDLRRQRASTGSPPGSRIVFIFWPHPINRLVFKQLASSNQFGGRDFRDLLHWKIQCGYLHRTLDEASQLSEIDKSIEVWRCAPKQCAMTGKRWRRL